jgi:hypothetical protein
MTQIKAEEERARVNRIGRPPKRPTPKLSLQSLLKIRGVISDAAKNAPDEVKLQREMSFPEVAEELSEAVGRFFAIGYGLADGVEIVKSLKLNLTESEIKNILIQSRLQYENDIT